MKGEAHGPVRVTRKALHFLSADPIPKEHGSVPGTRRQEAWVGAEGQRRDHIPVSDQGPDLPAGLAIPQPHGFVPASRGDRLAVGTERDRSSLSAVTGWREFFAFCFRVPDLNGRVESPAGE